MARCANRPVASVVSTVRPPVEFVIVTSAPGIAPPDGSRTTPVIRPEGVVSACADRGGLALNGDREEEESQEKGTAEPIHEASVSILRLSLK